MLLNLPNSLVFVRIALIPLILYLILAQPIAYSTPLALLLFIAASLTDFLDGWLARKRDQITTFGKYADPIADKLLILTTLFSFASLEQIASIWVWLILIRETGVLILRAYAASRGVVMAAEMTSKLKTISQIALVITLFIVYQWGLGELGQFVKHLLTFMAVGLTLLSGIGYLMKSRGLFRTTS